MTVARNTAAGTAQTPAPAETFAALVALLRPYQAQLQCTADSAEAYSLDTAFLMPNRKPLFFAAVKRGRTDVSLHCMPVYVFPELLTDLPAELRKCLKGKSCFHFKQISEAERTALAQLLQAGWQRYRAAGYVS